MEVASHHRRDESLSSFGSLYSVEVDLAMDDFMVSDSDVRSTRPRRQRLGAEMAIIAATSPEIKALNLPSTPCFPSGMESYHHRSNSNGTFSSCSSMSSAGSRRKGALSPLLASMDDVDCSPVHYGKLDQPSMPIFKDETEDIIHSFKAANLKDVGQQTRPHKSDSQKHVWFEDKENIHPNLLQGTDHGQKPFSFHSRNHEYRQAKAYQRPPIRSSLHRRASLDNLPSPDEIRGLPKPVLRAASISIPYFPSDLSKPKVNQLRRSDHQRGRIPRSSSLMTGFPMKSL